MIVQVQVEEKLSVQALVLLESCLKEEVWSKVKVLLWA